MLGILGSLIGGGKISKSILSTGLKVVDELYESDEEKKIAQRTLAEIDAKLKEKQIEVNIAEAKHKSLFVAGWRPFIGWTCGIALAWTYVGTPILQFILAQTGHLIDLPSLDMSQMMPVLLGMLGLGGLRTFEKFKGVSK